MKRKPAPCSQEELKQFFHYDPDTGVFTWIKKTAPKSRIPVGSIAGVEYKGRCFIGFRYKTYLAHQLAWLYMTGQWVDQIDHKDLNPLNNRFNNLRPATHSTNSANTTLRKDNTSGYKGVGIVKTTGRFTAEIWHNKKKYRIGTFATAEEASNAYHEAAKQFFGEFARLR